MTPGHDYRYNEAHIGAQPFSGRWKRMAPDASTQRFDPATTTRPVPALMTYYLIVSMFTLVAFPIVVLPLLFKYYSLRYRFDDEGVSMSWGVLYKREIFLTYRRIQDIHVSRGIIQRQFGLATVAVQTASGSTGAQMSIEGIGDPEGLRDYLYSKMRGSRHETGPGETQVAVNTAVSADTASGDEALVLLQEILEQIKALRSDRAAGEVDNGRA
jgi:putative membrane protein